MNDFVAQSLILASQIIFIVATLSQYVKILTTKTTKGLSGWTYTLFTGSIIAWGFYGLKEKLIIFYVSHFLSALICFGILGHIYSKSKIRRKMELYALAVGLLLFILLFKFPLYSGWIGFTFTMIARIPQYKHLYTDKNIRGVSLLACLLFIIANIFTVIYALYYSMTPLVLSANFAAASSMFIMFMVAKKQVDRRRLALR